MISSPEHEEDVDEQSSLLPHPSNAQRPGHQRTSSLISHIPTVHSKRSVLYTLWVIIVIVAFGDFVIVVPQTRIIENILCHKYYDSLVGPEHLGLNENIDEDLCKGDIIQKELSYIIGISDMMNAIPSIFCAIPYGILADKIGRRPVILLSMIGVLLSVIFSMVVLFFWQTFPLYLIFLSPILCFIGGGNAVFIAMINAMLADISTPEALAVNLSYLGSASIVAAMVAPMVGGALMTLPLGPWLPVMLGAIIFTFGTFLALILPETLKSQKLATPETPSSASLNSVEERQNRTFLSKLTSQIHHSFNETKEAFSVINTISLTLLLLTFFTHFWSNAIERFTSVYVSKRYHWHLSDTGFLLSLPGFINILLLVFILPYLSHLLSSSNSPLPRHYRLSTTKKDLMIARLLITLGALGAFIIAGPTVHFVIVGLVIFSLGHGFSIMVKSVATSMVDQRHIARLYSCISITDTLGAVAAGPALPWLFSMGLKKRDRDGSDSWIGLPYLVTAAIFVLAAIAVFFVKLPKKVEEVEADEVDRDA